MKNIRKFLNAICISVCVALLDGCVPSQPNIALDQKFWKESGKHPVVVAVAKNPQADLYKEGGQGLLDVAISSIATNSFSKYLQHDNLSDFNVIQWDFIHDLQKNYIQAHVYDGVIDIQKLQKVKLDSKIYAIKDYRPLSIKIKNDQLLLVNINLVGAQRQYYAMIPLSPPVAICSADGQLINLKNNKLLWRFTTTQVVKVEGKWDQPPNYPNFTNALKKSIYQTKQALIKNFFYTAPIQPTGELH